MWQSVPSLMIDVKDDMFNYKRFLFNRKLVSED